MQVAGSLPVCLSPDPVLLHYPGRIYFCNSVPRLCPIGGPDYNNTLQMTFYKAPWQAARSTSRTRTIEVYIYSPILLLAITSHSCILWSADRFLVLQGHRNPGMPRHLHRCRIFYPG